MFCSIMTIDGMSREKYQLLLGSAYRILMYHYQQ